MPLSRAPAATRLPPTAYLATGAVFHYLGPSLAVLLFAHVPVLGVAWLRIATAAAVFAAWRRPWRRTPAWGMAAVQWEAVIALGVVLAAMNTVFYLAVDRLPLSTVGAIEFLGVIALAAGAARTRRNLLALGLAVAGVLLLTDVRLSGEPLGFVFAFANCLLFTTYVVLGHRIARGAGAHVGGTRIQGDGTRTHGDGTGGAAPPAVDRLATAMIAAAVAVTPLGLGPAAKAFTHPMWLLAGAGVGICSSVIPYVTDQLAMARLPRATFAMMLSLLPAMATVIGAVVLAQVPTPQDLAGIALVTAGVAVHQDQQPHQGRRAGTDTKTRADAETRTRAATEGNTPDDVTRTRA
ncbi:DMT family transporter [Streptomyces sp. HPF1205]|uniref:EamA family transporter n=1 Tax=Streptomyces sp. HPF1205 TaxID=2873262 RepID=UPI001CEDEB57|nr:EamA family transporter [Streptomyces sp. HPF1205]